MAKLVEEIIVVKLSKLVKDNETLNDILDSKLVDNLESTVQDMVGAGVIVEVEKA